MILVQAGSCPYGPQVAFVVDLTYSGDFQYSAGAPEASTTAKMITGTKKQATVTSTSPCPVPHSATPPFHCLELELNEVVYSHWHTSLYRFICSYPG